MKFVSVLFALFWALPLHAGKMIEYKVGGKTFESYLAIPATKKLNNPAVLIVPDWMGLGDYAKKKADDMAAQGYVAIAVDVYGKGNLPKDGKAAGELAGSLKKDTKTLRERINGAYDQLKKQGGLVDKTKIVAFGYCFGGTTVLELARSGAQLAGTATFHGGLANAKPADAKNIKGRVLVMHGAIDPFVPTSEVEAFQKEMNDAKIDYTFVSYSGAVHSFTIPDAGNDTSKGAAYNATADKRSWAEFERFLGEVAPL